MMTDKQLQELVDERHADYLAEERAEIQAIPKERAEIQAISKELA